MLGTFTADVDTTNNMVWFEIPADSQGLVSEYLYSVIDEHASPIVRKTFKDMLRKQGDADSNNFYPVSYNGEIVFFYKLLDAWRVGSTSNRNTIADLGLKEAILQDISNVLIPA